MGWNKILLPPGRHKHVPQCMAGQAELKLEFQPWLVPLDADPQVQQTQFSAAVLPEDRFTKL